MPRLNRSPISRSVCFLLALCFIGSFSHFCSAEDSSPSVSFHKQIRPIFARHCYGCHQGSKQGGEYDMLVPKNLLAGGESGLAAIVPGKPDESHLISQITSTDGFAEMPKAPMAALTEKDVAVVRQWIQEGAIDDSPSVKAPFDSEHPPVYAATPSMPSLDASPTEDLVAVAGYHEVLLLNVRPAADASSSSELIRHRLIGISPRIDCVKFSPDGKRLAVAGGTPAFSGELQVWNVSTGQLLLSIAKAHDTLTGISWSPDGSLIAVAANDNTYFALDSQTGEQKLFQGAHEDWVRGTAFTNDGKHIVSVARDMTCKLTEVETQRFIDNVTSITPGALSGGLNTVATHPSRHEVVVGGADGVAKVYRIFRETERKIGDDANLIRSLPALKGRITSIALSADASHIVAAATIDGRSEVAIWKYDFLGTVGDEIKAILAKQVSERSAEEKQKADAAVNSPVTEVARITIDAATYGVDFSSRNHVVTSGDDGVVRTWSLDGKLQQELRPIKIDSAAVASMRQFDVSGWNFDLPSSTAKPKAESTIVSLQVDPPSIEFDSPYDYVQVVVTGVTASGQQVDLTRNCQLNLGDWVSADAGGIVRPLADGAGDLKITYGGQKITLPIKATNIVAPKSDDASTQVAHDFAAVDFVRDVNPVLTRLGCNQGTCHGAQKGKAGFRLSLRGYDPIFDIRALTDDLSARRIDPAAPEQSLMLRKPLGDAPHQGGVLMNAGDRYHTILRRWIADGSQLISPGSVVQSIAVSPLNPTVQTIGDCQQVRVVATMRDGTTRDVTRESFIESGNTEVARAEIGGLLTSVRRGEAPILARYEGSYAATTLTVMGDRSEYQEPQTETWNEIDELVAKKWQRMKVTPSPLCDDATFLRRIHLDLTGLPPTADAVKAFLADTAPTREKRARAIDALIGNPDYVVYWTNKWADLLQVNRKFLGVEGAQEFHQWIQQSVANGKPYDQFANEIITATGSNHENPPASYFKTLRDPELILENTTHLFLGIRFNCNKCHDHPFERWTQDQYYQTAAFFAQVGFENDPAANGRTIEGSAVDSAKPLFEKIIDKPDGEIKHPRTSDNVAPTFPFEYERKATEATTRREKFARWMTDPANPYFARSYVNRLWAAMTGVGLIEPIDDIRAGNPATNPELLEYLTKQFIDSGFDIRAMQRLIANSRTYQLSIETAPMNADDELNYSHARARRLPAEVIFDAVHLATGATSRIPGVPDGTRAASLADSGIKTDDGFLANLGRPVRESACECERSTGLQLGPVMALVSGPTIGAAISDPSNDLKSIVDSTSDPAVLADELFVRFLGRPAKPAEVEAFASMMPQVTENHESLVKRLEESEKTWSVRFEQLESERKQAITGTQSSLDKRIADIAPEQERLAKERTERIEEATANLTKVQNGLADKIKTFVTQQKQAIEWHPLTATKLKTTTKGALVAQPDRSILASGEHEKGIYTVTCVTSLDNITGIRIEAISDPKLPSVGPGFGDNGNFVVTELEVRATLAGEKRPKPLKIESGKADFEQNSFSINQVFDGKPRDQGGWAVAGATGRDHWAVLKLSEPIKGAGKKTLQFDLSQFHNAAKHRLGRFRISVTTAQGDLPLGLSETLAADVATPEESRSEESKQRLTAIVASNDPDIAKAQTALNEANQPTPADAMVTELQGKLKRLETVTPIDSRLIRLREDVAQSAEQIKNVRLTSAEDLAWALINSPAFLFNH